MHEASLCPPLSTWSLAATRRGLCLYASVCSGNFYQWDHAVRSLCSLAFPTLHHVSASCPSFLVSLLWPSLGDGAGLGGGGGEFGWTQRIGLGQRLLRPLSDDAEMQTASAVRNVCKTLSSSASTPAETMTCFLFLFVYPISSPKDGWRKSFVQLKLHLLTIFIQFQWFGRDFVCVCVCNFFFNRRTVALQYCVNQTQVYIYPRPLEPPSPSRIPRL